MLFNEALNTHSPHDIPPGLYTNPLKRIIFTRRMKTICAYKTNNITLVFCLVFKTHQHSSDYIVAISAGPHQAKVRKNRVVIRSTFVNVLSRRIGDV